MLLVILLWFLFAFPALILYAVVQGARLYAQAQHQQVPGATPKFGFSRARPKMPAGNGDNRLPEV